MAATSTTTANVADEK